MNGDGSFGDMSGAPVGMAEMVTAKGWTNVEAVTKSYAELEAHQGTMKQQLNLPETLTDDMTTRIHKKLGRPETPDGYTFAEGADALKPEVLTAIKGLAHKQGLNGPQANAIVSQLLEVANGELQTQQAEIAAVEKALKEKHGDKYDTYMEEAFNVSEKLGITATLDKKGLNRDPEVIEMLHKFNSKLSEASLETGGGGIGGGQTVDEKIRKLTESPAYTDKMHVDHHKTVVEIKSLLAQKHNVTG